MISCNVVEVVGTRFIGPASVYSGNTIAMFDFTGTGREVYGNFNAPKAVTYSAVIYSLRCLVGTDIPLNQGCLNPIKIIIPATATVLLILISLSTSIAECKNDSFLNTL